MLNTKLIKLFRTFNKDELKSLEKFLKSPFLKPARDTCELFKYLIKFYPDYDSAKLEKEQAYKKLFPGEKYSETKINNYIFDLTKASEEFLAHITLKDDQVEFLLNLSKGYLQKKLPAESQKINKQIEKKLKPGFFPGKDYISKFRRLTYLQSSYFTAVNDFENIIECKKNYFEASAVQFFIDYAEIEGSKDSAIATYGKEIDNPFITAMFKSFDPDTLFRFLEGKDFRNKTLIDIHYYMLKTAQEPENKEHYFSMRDLFYKNIGEFDREEKYLLHNHLVNYCVKNFRDKEFQKESLNVYKSMLENSAYSLSENDFMHVMIYRNIVQISITVNELNWLESFIENYSILLEPEFREDLKNLSCGNLYFLRKEYIKALGVLNKINHEFFLFKADLKNLLLLLYYELDYTEQAFSMVDSYKHFLSNTNEITKEYKDTYRNFLNFYFELLKIKSHQSREKPGFVRKKIEKEKNLISKKWLLEKSDELM